MRILHVAAAAERGGLEVVLLNLLQSIDRSRFSPQVLLLEDGPLVREIEETGTETHVIQSGRVRDVFTGRRAIADMVKLIRSQGISLVHSHNSKAHIYGGLAAAIAGVPALYHLHGVPKLTFTRDGVISLLSMAIPARRIVACSTYVATAFRRAWHSRREIAVVHNGVMPRVPSAAASPNIRAEFGVPEDAFLVVMAARLQRWKGVHVLLNAAAQVTKDYPQVYFIVVGGTLFGLEEGYASELSEQIERLNLGTVVRLAGFRTDVERFYLAADLVVHSSIEPEPFGMVLLEAMASGRPVVASDCGGPREIVVNGVTGLLVPPNDVKLLAEGILALLKDPESRVRMGQAGASRFREFFGADRMVRQIETLYERMIEESTAK
jgi:glycosyltransferase involved in cell wall biosynthesis